jgi:hypothetical protein
MRPRAQSSAQRYYGTTRDSLLNCLFIVKRWVEEWGGWFSHEVSEASTAGSSYPCAALRNCFDDAHPMDGNWKPDKAAQQQTRRDEAGPRSRNETSSVPARISNESMALCRHAVDSGGHRSRDTCPGGRREAARRRLCSALLCVEYSIRQGLAIFARPLLIVPPARVESKVFSPCTVGDARTRARQVRLAWTATRGGRAAVLCAPAPGTASRVPTVCSKITIRQFSTCSLGSPIRAVGAPDTLRVAGHCRSSRACGDFFFIGWVTHAREVRLVG